MVGWLAHRDKNGAIGRMLYNLSESAFETKILSLLCGFDCLKARTRIQREHLCSELVRKQKHLSFPTNNSN